MTIATELVLYNGCLIGTPIREFAEAARGAGFDAVTIWPRTYQRALKREGLAPAAIKHILDGSGVRCVEIEGYDAWLPSVAREPNPFTSLWDQSDFFDAAAELGADTISVAVTDSTPVSHQAAVDGFGAVCSAAAVHGLRVSLEFVAFGAISNITSACNIVRDARQPNGGLTIDMHHLRRGGAGADGTWPAIPAEAVFGVQLCDGPLLAPYDLVGEAMYGRTPPGTGDFEVHTLIGTLAALGVRTRVGPELFSPQLAAQDSKHTATLLLDATKAVLGMQTSPDPGRQR